MQNENIYIGDDKFQRFLDHYACLTPLLTVKLKFLGAICSPNLNLRPADVIASLFDEHSQPRLQTKAEAELFFRFFMGLWDEMFEVVKTNTFSFPKAEKKDRDYLIALCQERGSALEFGFAEGFWGGCSSLSIPNFAAELMNSIADMADVYEMLADKLKNSEDPKDIYKVILNTDAMAEKTIHFLVEHLVLPHIAKLTRSVN